MFLWLKTLYRKRAVIWPFIFYTIIWTLSKKKMNSTRLIFVLILIGMVLGNLQPMLAWVGGLF
ncbi:hypothetical protein EG874_15185 [Enterococcus faecalis]|nr:hypothetical protein EG874_15185 [Enterococcus faecalis]